MNVSVNRSPTNNTQSNQKSDVKKRHADVNVRIPDENETVTTDKLKEQVDDLIENFNKLAKRLNHPEILEDNFHNSKLTNKRVVSQKEWSILGKRPTFCLTDRPVHSVTR